MSTDDEKVAAINQTDEQSPPDTLLDIRIRAELALEQCQNRIAKLRAQRDEINNQLRPLVREEPLLASAVRYLTPKDERS